MIGRSTTNTLEKFSRLRVCTIGAPWGLGLPTTYCGGILYLLMNRNPTLPCWTAQIKSGSSSTLTTTVLNRFLFHNIAECQKELRPRMRRIEGNSFNEFF